MKKMYCAIDGGNSTIEVVINGQRCPVAFPSMDCEPDKEYTDVMKVGSIGKPNHEKLHVTLQKNREKNSSVKEFVFGHMAEAYGKSKRNRENFDKSADPQLVEWMLTALAYGIYDKERKEKGVPDNKIKAEIVLSVGLPFHEAKNVENKKRFGKAFKGNHIIEFQHPAFDGAAVEINVSTVYINVEGEASLGRIIFDPDGECSKLAPEDLLNRVYTMVNCGGFSTEIIGMQFLKADSGDEYIDMFDEDYELSINPETQTHLTAGIQKGVGTAMIDTLKNIEENETMIKRSLIRRDIEVALSRGGKNPDTNTLGWILPEKVNINKYFSKHIKRLAEHVSQKLHSLYTANNVKSQVQKIYLSGGGSKIDLFVETFTAEMVNYGYDENIIVQDPDPIFADAHGYYEAMMETEEAYQEDHDLSDVG